MANTKRKTPKDAFAAPVSDSNPAGVSSGTPTLEERLADAEARSKVAVLLLAEVANRLDGLRLAILKAVSP